MLSRRHAGGPERFLLGPVAFGLPLIGGNAQFAWTIPCDANLRNLELDWRIAVPGAGLAVRTHREPERFQHPESDDSRLTESNGLESTLRVLSDSCNSVDA